VYFADRRREDKRETDNPDSRRSPSRRAADIEAPPAWDIDVAPPADAH